jgi:hypothetical protein
VCYLMEKTLHLQRCKNRMVYDFCTLGEYLSDVQVLELCRFLYPRAGERGYFIPQELPNFLSDENLGPSSSYKSWESAYDILCGILSMVDQITGSYDITVKKGYYNKIKSFSLRKDRKDYHLEFIDFDRLSQFERTLQSVLGGYAAVTNLIPIYQGISVYCRRISPVPIYGQLVWSPGSLYNTENTYLRFFMSGQWNSLAFYDTNLLPAFTSLLVKVAARYFERLQPCVEVEDLPLFGEVRAYNGKKKRVQESSERSLQRRFKSSKIQYGFIKSNQEAFLEDTSLLQTKYNLESEEVKKITKSVDCVLELYYVFGLMPHRLVSYNSLPFVERCATFRTNAIRYKSVHKLLLFVSKNGPGSWIKFWKWKLASFFSHCYNQEPVPLPKLSFGHAQKLDCFFRKDVLLGGACHDFFSALKGDEREDFLASVLQLKKGMPRPPKSFVDDSVKETISILTTEAEPTDSLLIDPIKEEIDWVVDSVFRRAELRKEDVYHPFFPSTSACFQRPVSKGGAAERLSIIIKENELWEYFDPHQVLYGSKMMELGSETSRNYGNYGRHDQMKLDFKEDMGITELGSVDIFNFEDFDCQYKRLYDSLFALAKEEENLVKPVGLLEALKVRVITKGPAIRGYVLKMFQKFLFRSLRKFEIFKYIGEPLCLQNIQDFLQCIEDGSYYYLDPDDVPAGETLEEDYETNGSYFISGDYKASTDYLKSWISNYIVKRIFYNIRWSFNHLDFPKDFLDDLEQLVLAALTGHTIRVYSEPKVYVDIAQKNGQLMGSIVSFPILCLANASLCSLTIRKDRERRGMNMPPFKKLPMRINGDDCLLLGTGQDFKKDWLLYGKAFGLQSSVGKTYFSNRIATLNSLNFIRTGRTWKQAKAVNLGLLYGYKRSSESEESPGIGSLGVLCRELLADWSKDSFQYKYLQKRFLMQHSKALKGTTLSWFAPEWAGGLGIPGDISDIDRRIVSIIREKFSTKVIPVNDPSLWIVHQKMKELFPSSDNYYKTFLSESMVLRSETINFWDEAPLCRGALTRFSYDFEEEYHKIYGRLSTLLFLNGCKSTIQTNIFTDKDTGKKGQYCYFTNHSLRKEGIICPSAEPPIRTKLRHNEKLWEKILHDLGKYSPILIEDEELQSEPKKLFPAWAVQRLEWFIPFQWVMINPDDTLEGALCTLV